MAAKYALITLENNNGLQEWYSHTLQTFDADATQATLDARAEELAATEWRDELADDVDEWDDNPQVTVQRAQFIPQKDYAVLRKYFGEA